MKQLFKRVIQDNTVRLREVVLVNNNLGDEFLLNVIVNYTDQDASQAKQFTHSSHTDQQDVLLRMLLQNGYKEGVEGMHLALEQPYATYETGQPFMSHIAHRTTIVNVANLFATGEQLIYVRNMPLNAHVLHYNGLLRDKWGIPITGVSESILEQLCALYGMCQIGFDIALYNDASGQETYTILDFAYDANYTQRRNLFYNYELDKHLDTPIRSEQELEQFIAKLSGNESHTYNLVIKQPSCMYEHGAAMSGAYNMRVMNLVGQTSEQLIENVIQATSIETKEKQDVTDIRTMCVRGGILL